MSLTATARSIPGSLRQEIVIDGKHHLTTDEPEAVGGEGMAPAPHELLPAALAGCVSTVLVMYARTKEWDLGEVSVNVEYDHHATPRRFEVAITLTGDLTPAQLERLEKVAATCPVRRSIETGIEFVESIESRRESAVQDVRFGHSS
jgi:putative redox protein